MKKIAFLLLVAVLCLHSTGFTQTASFNFSLGANVVSGWTNVSGDPKVAVRTATDGVTGISISSVSTTNWVPVNNACAYDGWGSPGGTFFPAAVMLDHWYQYSGTLANYNAAIPQLQISGLNPDSLYTLKMTGSNKSGYNTNPTRYTVAGYSVVGYQDINTLANISNGATFYNVQPDVTGKIKVYVNTLSTTEAADICGIQITRSSLIPLPVVNITSPQSGDLLSEDANVNISATATITSGTISKVEFFHDTTKIGESAVSPFSSTWTNPDPGNYVLKAKATDFTGRTVTATINVTVESLNSFWSMTGNSNVVPDSEFVGTVDKKPLIFKTNNTERARFDSTSGIFYIGGKLLPASADSTTKLAVKGAIHAKKVKVTISDWPDFVFAKAYPLKSLPELEGYIKAHLHLPGVEPEGKIKKDGLDLGIGQALLLEKIEELTLYTIQLNKEVMTLKKQIRVLQKNHHNGKKGNSLPKVK